MDSCEFLWLSRSWNHHVCQAKFLLPLKFHKKSALQLQCLETWEISQPIKDEVMDWPENTNFAEDIDIEYLLPSNFRQNLCSAVAKKEAKNGPANQTQGRSSLLMDECYKLLLFYWRIDSKKHKLSQVCQVLTSRYVSLNPFIGPRHTFSRERQVLTP